MDMERLGLMGTGLDDGMKIAPLNLSHLTLKLSIYPLQFLISFWWFFNLPLWWFFVSRGVCGCTSNKEDGETRIRWWRVNQQQAKWGGGKTRSWCYHVHRCDSCCLPRMACGEFFYHLIICSWWLFWIWFVVFNLSIYLFKKRSRRTSLGGGRRGWWGLIPTTFTTEGGMRRRRSPMCLEHRGTLDPFWRSGWWRTRIVASQSLTMMKGKLCSSNTPPKLWLTVVCLILCLSCNVFWIAEIVAKIRYIIRGFWTISRLNQKV